MNDYYQTLGIPENAGDEDIRKAFRKLAFQHHPDKNPGHEREAEEKFKDINEAYGVLSDQAKRRQYDSFRHGRSFAGTAYGPPYQDFRYSQQDIFRDTFANQATTDDLRRMFAQAGLRFDPDFLNRVFFGRNVLFHVRFGSMGPETYDYASRSDSRTPSAQPASQPRRPGLVERGLMKFFGFVLRKLLGVSAAPAVSILDQYQELKLSAAEARSGGEKEVNLSGDKRARRLVVKIPAGIAAGTQIRLKGMGKKNGGSRGDVYLTVRLVG